MILEFDIGNTRIKWRLVDSTTGNVCYQGFGDDVEQLLAKISATVESPSGVRFCSVRNTEYAQNLPNWVRRYWDIPVMAAAVQRSFAGVTIFYDDLDRLGADRWLAMLAAYKRAAGPCIVVDAGTAFTLDALDRDGNHQGGYIVPGLDLMGGSLESATQIQLKEKPASISVELGQSTEAAIYQGALAALTQLARATWHRLQDGEVAPRLFILGGDAQLFVEQCPECKPERVDELVFEGLAIACPMDSIAG